MIRGKFDFEVWSKRRRFVRFTERTLGKMLSQSVNLEARQELKGKMFAVILEDDKHYTFAEPVTKVNYCVQLVVDGFNDYLHKALKFPKELFEPC